MTRLTRALWAIYAFLWIGGLISGGVSKAAPLAAPGFLILAGVLTLLASRDSWKPLLAAAGIGFAFEIVGVHTGLPFGRYSYTGTLAPSLLGVPVAIGFAWLILIDFTRRATTSLWLGALLMTAIDLAIDPLAAGPLHYWTWFESGPWYGIPTRNFAGWFLASLAILYAGKTPVKLTAFTPGLTVIAFFTALALEFHLWPPAAIGALIVSLPPLQALWRRPSETSSSTIPASR